MRRLILAIAAGAVSLSALSPAAAAPAAGARPSVTFRLQVSGQVTSATTFWVAYGPLAGRFGLIRLRASGGNTFTATSRLPAGRTVFAYLAGQGAINTQFGPAPGDPVVTIKRVGPVLVGRTSLPLVRWQAPVG